MGTERYDYYTLGKSKFNEATQSLSQGEAAVASTDKIKHFDNAHSELIKAFKNFKLAKATTPATTRDAELTDNELDTFTAQSYKNFIHTASRLSSTYADAGNMDVFMMTVTKTTGLAARNLSTEMAPEKFEFIRLGIKYQGLFSSGVADVAASIGAGTLASDYNTATGNTFSDDFPTWENDFPGDIANQTVSATLALVIKYKDLYSNYPDLDYQAGLIDPAAFATTYADHATDLPNILDVLPVYASHPALVKLIEFKDLFENVENVASHIAVGDLDTAYNSATGNSFGTDFPNWPANMGIGDSSVALSTDAVLELAVKHQNMAGDVYDLVFQDELTKYRYPSLDAFHPDFATDFPSLYDPSTAITTVSNTFEAFVSGELMSNLANFLHIAAQSMITSNSQEMIENAIPCLEFAAVNTAGTASEVFALKYDLANAYHKLGIINKSNGDTSVAEDAFNQAITKFQVALVDAITLVDVSAQLNIYAKLAMLVNISNLDWTAFTDATTFLNNAMGFVNTQTVGSLGGDDQSNVSIICIHQGIYDTINASDITPSALTKWSDANGSAKPLEIYERIIQEALLKSSRDGDDASRAAMLIKVFTQVVALSDTDYDTKLDKVNDYLHNIFGTNPNGSLNAGQIQAIEDDYQSSTLGNPGHTWTQADFDFF